MRNVRLLILDVDGVLTDGTTLVGPSGEDWVRFDVQDGLAIKQLIAAGVEVAVITGRSVTSVERRCRALGIERVETGVRDKLTAYRKLLASLAVPDEEVCYMGDDLNDLGPLMACGHGVTVPNARREVLDRATHVTHRSGGAGAVREICERILRAKGLWEEIVERFIRGEAR
jgi:3-deoxy-D-manno-octulosonate 8-phosphate phosphatase (KDO 8-P phosphatase)